jgi:hypothetical protein
MINTSNIQSNYTSFDIGIVIQNKLAQSAVDQIYAGFYNIGDSKAYNNAHQLMIFAIIMTIGSQNRSV